MTGPKKSVTQTEPKCLPLLFCSRSSWRGNNWGNFSFPAHESAELNPTAAQPAFCRIPGDVESAWWPNPRRWPQAGLEQACHVTAGQCISWAIGAVSLEVCRWSRGAAWNVVLLLLSLTFHLCVLWASYLVFHSVFSAQEDFIFSLLPPCHSAENHLWGNGVMKLEVVRQLDDIIYDHKDTFLYIFISSLFWISVEILLDLLMEMKKRYRSNLDNTKLANLEIWVKPQGKNWAFPPGLASLGQWSYCSCLYLKKTQPHICLGQYRSFLFVKQSMLSNLQVILGCIPAWGNCRKQGIWKKCKVSHISQHRGGNDIMFGAGQRQATAWLLKWYSFGLSTQNHFPRFESCENFVPKS